MAELRQSRGKPMGASNSGLGVATMPHLRPTAARVAACAVRGGERNVPGSGGIGPERHQQEVLACLCGICTPWCASPTSSRAWISIATSSACRRSAGVENEAGRYTLVFLAAPHDKAAPAAERAPLLELTFNWDPEKYGEGRNFGHLAFEVDDIYALCDRLMKAGVTINRPPRDGRMAFVRSPDNISIELLQKGEAQPKKEPWASMPNTGKW